MKNKYKVIYKNYSSESCKNIYIDVFYKGIKKSLTYRLYDNYIYISKGTTLKHIIKIEKNIEKTARLIYVLRKHFELPKYKTHDILMLLK